MLLSEGSPSTPMCGVGEAGASITPHTEVLKSIALNPVENFPWSLTLILSGKYSQNSEAQLVFNQDMYHLLCLKGCLKEIYQREHMFEGLVPYLHEPEVCEFYYKMELLDDEGIRTTVPEMTISLREESLGIILGVSIPLKGSGSLKGANRLSILLKGLPRRGYESCWAS
ncbi:hypothetical protein H5410_023881 [Solanum commersonii]|uniref:Uncharacterized protein n=1 Tax=Solanum commersonii TaxID=4109 RepID=A0A9J5ZKF2_SOLCO|nr:hypothetical protein H5410_023881 [Solanum commersonii]